MGLKIANAEQAQEAKEYRALLVRHNQEEIGLTLGDYALYDFMTTLRELGEEPYNESRDAEKDEYKKSTLLLKYINRTRQLLEDSGYDQKNIDNIISKFSRVIMNFSCWPAKLKTIFDEKSRPETPWNQYFEELEEAEAKSEIKRPEIATKTEITPDTALRTALAGSDIESTDSAKQEENRGTNQPNKTFE